VSGGPSSEPSWDRLAAAIPRHEGRSAADAAAPGSSSWTLGIVLLAAHVQRYCRELHAEAARALARHVRPRAADKVVEGPARRGARASAAATHTPTPSPQRLRRRLGLDVWKRMAERSRVTPIAPVGSDHPEYVEECHRSPDPPARRPGAAVARTARTVAFLRRWRATCGTLADDLDRVVSQYLTDLVGAQPW